MLYSTLAFSKWMLYCSVRFVGRMESYQVKDTMICSRSLLIGKRVSIRDNTLKYLQGHGQATPVGKQAASKQTKPGSPYQLYRCNSELGVNQFSRWQVWPVHTVSQVCRSG